MPTTQSLTAQITGHQRIVRRVVRFCNTILRAAGELGIDAPKRRYRKRKPATGAKAASEKSAKRTQKTHIHKAREEE